MKDENQMEALVKKFGLQAFEMEGSGIAYAAWIDEIGYMIVRGISDYADSFKNDINNLTLNGSPILVSRLMLFRKR